MMRRINKLLILLFVVCGQLAYCACFAKEQGSPKEDAVSEVAKPSVNSSATTEPKQYLFLGEVKESNVNIRSDSTTSAEIVCKVNKNDQLEVLSESYGWYKVRLPANAPVFIKKEFVSLNEEKTAAKVSKENVNIRLRPDLSAPILGKLALDEPVNISKDLGEWYKIEPVKNSFGWIHGNLVNKIDEEKLKLAAAKKNAPAGEQITVEGIIKPKTVTNLATHKLTAQDKKLYLLTSSKENLDSFNNRKVKITGILAEPARKNPLIEVEKIEAVN